MSVPVAVILCVGVMEAEEVPGFAGLKPNFLTSLPQGSMTENIRTENPASLSGLSGTCAGTHTCTHICAHTKPIHHKHISVYLHKGKRKKSKHKATETVLPSINRKETKLIFIDTNNA